MNCANHPETPAVSYCQYCGKPLCAECVHKVNNIVSCEPCLAARLHAATTGTPYTRGAGYTAGGPLPPGTMPLQDTQPWGTSPAAAFWLGWIPGVGAMYNGQLAKGLAHVIIFAVLVGLTHWNGAIGIVVAAWVVYQAFDAYHTAAARRDGLPLPNPLGLNDVGRWFGARQGTYSAPPSGTTPAGAAPIPPGPAAVPPQSVPGNPPVSGFASQYAPPPYSAPVPPPVPPVPPHPQNMGNFWCSGRRGFPTGAIILIVLGVLFLLGNIGVLSENWFDRGWPILLIIIGIGIVIRHSQTPPAGGVR